MTGGRWSAVAALVLATLGYLGLIFATRALDPAAAGWIGRMDLWTAQLFFGLRSPALVGFFSTVTAFGYWGVVVLLAVAATALMLLYRRGLYVPGLWLGLIGNQITVTLLKTIFGRARPAFGVYHESSAAFPSGHSAVSVMLFGYFTFLLLRESPAPRFLVALAGLVVILLVGGSRLYLVEHYLSDVLSGYLIGSVWLVLAIALTRTRAAKMPPAVALPVWPWRGIAVLTLVAATLVALWFAAGRYERHLVLLPPPASSDTAAP